MKLPLPETAMGPGKWKTFFFICWCAVLIYCGPKTGDQYFDIALFFTRLVLVLVGWIAVYEPGLSSKLRARIFIGANIPLIVWFYLYCVSLQQPDDWVNRILFPALLIASAWLVFVADWFRLRRTSVPKLQKVPGTPFRNCALLPLSKAGSLFADPDLRRRAWRGSARDFPSKGQGIGVGWAGAL